MKQLSLPLKDIYPLIAETLGGGGEVYITVRGSSMSPFLHDGRDQAVFASVADRRIRRGDIVFYQRRGGQFVMHRVYSVDAEGTLTMLGDAQVALEPDIEPEQIIALSKAFIRKGKRIECNSFIYKSYSYLWYLAYPLRKFYFFSRRTGGKILRALNLRK